MPNQEETALHSITTHFTLTDAQTASFGNNRISDRIDIHPPISIGEILRQLEQERRKARLAIEQKAASLGTLPGSAMGDFVEVLMIVNPLARGIYESTKLIWFTRGKTGKAPAQVNLFQLPLEFARFSIERQNFLTSLSSGSNVGRLENMKGTLHA